MNKKSREMQFTLRFILWNASWVLLLLLVCTSRALPIFVGAFSTRFGTSFHSQSYANGAPFRGRSRVNYESNDAIGGLVLQDNAPSKAPTKGLPPWLAQYEGATEDLQDSSTRLLEEVQRNLSVLRALLDSSGRFTIDEVNDVMEALSSAADGDLAKLSGAAEFLWLLLSVEDCQQYDDETSTNDAVFECLMSRDSLIASAFHYCDCVSARNNGLYEIIEEAVTLSTTPSLLQESSSKSHRLKCENFLTLGVDGILKTQGAITDDNAGIQSTTKNGIERFGEDATRIALSAARIKSTEVMADVVIGRKDMAPTREQAGSLQNLLVSVSEDWQSLAIRSVASLYRLRGIVAFREKVAERSMFPTSSCEETIDIQPIDAGIIQYKSLANEGIKVSREALNIYAPIAQRLGMHRLKNELEGTAFRVLYPRQYSAAMSLYQNNLDKMRAVAENIKDTINQIIHEDDLLNIHTESIAIYSRVKEPYSLWRKLLKLRMRQLEKDGKSSKQSSTISILDVNDAIALRIIIKPKRQSMEESEESIRTREKLLCYYVQKICTDRWQIVDPARAKDYIAKPKANGYQSLHHTSQIFRHGLNWPFEIQIRSENMHRTAEFGVAAHWDYKLQAKGIEALSSGSGNSNVLALPSGNLNKNSMAVDDLTSSRDRAMKLAPYLEALTNARAEMNQRNVFVFVSSSGNGNEGKVIPLSASSSVHSAVSEYNRLHNIFSETEDEIVFLNGAPLSSKALKTTILRNGDVISLLTMATDD